MRPLRVLRCAGSRWELTVRTCGRGNLMQLQHSITQETYVHATQRLSFSESAMSDHWNRAGEKELCGLVLHHTR
jgi:hypothetical protein